MSESPDRHRREAELFEQACELAPEDQETFLVRACEGDAGLERRLRALLERDRGTRLRGLTAPAARALHEELAGKDDLPERIGAYRIVARIGAGGMGVVYEAEQEQPRRSVAVKVLRAGLVSEEHVRRFEHEVEVLGWLEHPGIARIFEAGMADTGRGPQPFFAMELVRGRTLSDHAREERLDTTARLELLARVCDAVHHAHRKGVVHRDLKPGNVLVEADGQPKVLDFGVARVVGADLETTTLETQPGQLLGTLPYMSPEQVAGDPAEIDTRVDVYALGVMAYELLAGSLPLDVSRKELAEAARIIQQDEPSSLGAIDRRLRGDVETIVSKAIDKDKERRYASAEELARDIRRHLANEPIEARPPSALYQLGKFARRNRALVGGVAGIIVALAAGLVVSLGLYRQSESRGERLAEAVELANDALAKERLARDEAEQALIELRRTEEWFNGFFAAASPTEDGTRVRVVEVLDRVAASVDTAFPDRPLARVRLLRRIGSTYVDIGLPDKGLPFLERASALVRAQPSPDAGERIRVEHDLAYATQRSERYEEAIPLYRGALARVAALRQEPSASTIGLHLGLAQCLTVVSRLDEAAVEARAALELAGKTGPAGEERLADGHQLLAAIDMQRGLFEDARTHVEDALAILEESEPDSWATCDALFMASQIASYQRRYEEAEELVWRSFQGLERLGGNDHPASLARLETLGVIYSQTGRSEEALAVFGDALAMSERMLEGPSGSHATMLGHIGHVHMRARRFDEAEAYLRDAVAELRASRAGGLDLSSALSNLANTLQRAGRFAEARPIIEEAIALREARADPNHYRIGYDYDVLARVLEGLGDAEGAAQAQARSDAIAEANRTRDAQNDSSS